MKRFTDLCIAVPVLIVLSPFMVVIALVVLFSGKGGILYRQKRVGRYNSDFTMFKFRTMFTGAEAGGLLTVGGRDPRVTPVGYWLRKYKLDELPQLFNVVAGQMSIVGPRPEVRRYVALYSPGQMKVLDVKPGITDPASIEFIDENELLSHAVNPDETYINEVMPRKLEINLRYIERSTWLNDLGIMAATLKALVR